MSEPLSENTLMGMREHVQQIHDRYHADSASSAELSLARDTQTLLDTLDRLLDDSERLCAESERLRDESERLRTKYEQLCERVNAAHEALGGGIRR